MCLQSNPIQSSPFNSNANKDGFLPYQRGQYNERKEEIQNTNKRGKKNSANESTLKRTVAPTDVFAALSELEFDSFRTRLEAELEAYTEIKAGKRKAKKPDADAEAEAGSGANGAGSAARDDDDVEMVDNPAKRVKRDSEGGKGVEEEGEGVDGDETQEEEIEDEQDDEDEDGEEDEDEEEGEEEQEKEEQEDPDRVEDLDGKRRLVDPDAEESEDDDGPGSQLRDDMGLG